jgi:hypothetical protein
MTFRPRLRRQILAAAPVAILLATSTACGAATQHVDVCSNANGALTASAFVFVQAPTSGERVASGFRVSGCSSTFEATLNWRLLGRDGRVLARSVTQGGGIEPGPFAFRVEYSGKRREVGSLEVSGPSVTTEGFPPPREIVPLVLRP